MLQENSLELVVIGEDGVLQSICEQTTFGIIKDVGVLNWRCTHFGLMPKVQFFLIAKHNTLQYFSCAYGCLYFSSDDRWEDNYLPYSFQIEGKEILVILSDSGKLSLLYFCSEMHRSVLLLSYLWHFFLSSQIKLLV